MPGAHRDMDSRFCGAGTVAKCNNVYVNGRLWAVDGNENTHGGGNLKAVVGNTVKIGGIDVIVAVGDAADSDSVPHSPPDTHPKDASTDVFAYG